MAHESPRLCQPQEGSRAPLSFRKCPTPTSGPSSPVWVHVPSLKHSGPGTRVSPSAFHRVNPEDLTEPPTAASGEVVVPQGHRLMTARQAPCRRSPCPRPAPQGTSIPPDPSPPSHETLPAPRLGDTTFPYTHTPCPAAFPDWDAAPIQPEDQHSSIPPTQPKSRCPLPSSTAHCREPRHPPRLHIVPAQPRHFSAAVPAGRTALVEGRAGGRAPCRGAALLCPISAAG